jgi:hypothetical protein
MKVLAGGGAMVGIAGEGYDVERPGETAKSIAGVRLYDGMTFIRSDISEDGKEHGHYALLKDLIPKTFPYDLALRIKKDGNMPQLRFNEDGEWHDFAPEGGTGLKAGPWFPYLFLSPGDRLSDHRVNRPRPVKGAGMNKSTAGPAHGVQRAVETMEDPPTPGIKLAAGGGGGGGGATASKKKSKRAPPSVKVPPRSVVAAKQGNNMSIAEEVKAKADRWTALVNCANEITTVACCPAGGGQGEGSQSASASLWLCSFVTACDAAFIQAERIGCIVTVGVGMKSELVSVAERHTLHVLDELHEDLTPHLDSTAELIGRNLDAGRSVVVHCECGISR